jgi:hypothetical protein
MAWWVWAVGPVCALAVVGCGSSERHPNGSAGTGGSTSTSGGSNATQGGGSGMSITAGAGGNGGAAPSACMSRATNHIAGTRIKYHVLRTAEGDEAYDGFYDSMSGEDCSEALAGDGKMRCVPSSRFRTTAYYTDAACTDPVYLQSDPTCGAAKYLELNDDSEPCQGHVQHYLAGAAYTGPVFQFTTSGGACAPSIDANLPLVRKGALIDPTTFAEFEPAVLPEAGRIARVGFKSPDGAFKVSGYLDTMFDSACSFGVMGDKKQHCKPRYSYVNAFSDMECKTLLLGVATACNLKPAQYFTRHVDDGCNSADVAVKTDQPFTGALFRADPMSDVCTPQGQQGPDISFFTSTDLPDSALPEVEFKTLDSDPGRLKPMYRTSSDGSCSFYDFWDSELQSECYFSGDPQSGYHCFPDNTTYAPLQAFSDAGCSTPVDYISAPTCFADTIPKYATSYSNVACGTRTPHVRKVSPGVTGANVSIFLGVPGSCTPLQADSESTYFTLEAELPTTAFISAERAPL